MPAMPQPSSVPFPRTVSQGPGELYPSPWAPYHSLSFMGSARGIPELVVCTVTALILR